MEYEKREASIVCLKNQVVVPPLFSGSCQIANLHFIPIKGNLHTIEAIQLVDVETREVTTAYDVLRVYIE